MKGKRVFLGGVAAGAIGGLLAERLAAHPDGIVVSIGCGLDTRFDRPEPRLGMTRLMRFAPLLNKGSSIVHYQLGSAGIGD